VTCTRIALPIPMLVQTAALRPWVRLWRTTIAKSGPGLATASMWATAILRNWLQ